MKAERRFKGCCWKWKDISRHGYKITFPKYSNIFGKIVPTFFDKRRVRFCPECSTPLYTVVELLGRLFGGGDK